MAASKKSSPADNSEPTSEKMQLTVTLLEALKPQFEQLIQEDAIEHGELESLTSRFSHTAIDLYGQNTVQAQRFSDWQPYYMFSYNTSTPDAEFQRQVQKAYHDGARRTLIELNSLLDQLELKLRHGGISKPSPSSEIALLLQLCKRLPISAKVLSRRRQNKATFDLTDEYDVQDLLQSIIRAYFKYSVAEEPISKIAGFSSRADFAIEELGVIIEVKYVHGPNEQERIAKQFAEDQQAYSQWPHLQHFIYVIYGSADLKDPELLEQLSGKRMLNGKEFTAYIICC